MNVGEYGIRFNLNVGYDISLYTTLALAFSRPDGSVLTVTSPAVTVGSSPLTTPLGTFAANQYASYVFADGDITVAGAYSARLTYTDANKRLVSEVVTFSVNP